MVEPTASVPPPPPAEEKDEPLLAPPTIVSLADLKPTLGGAEALEIRYRNVSFEDRSARMADIERGFAFYNESEHPDKAEADLYQALKDEWYWLQDHLSPKKP